MPLWVWVVAFVALLLAFGWLVDRRTKRRRRGLSARGPGGRLDDPIASAERIDPGISTRSSWIGQGDHGAGGGAP